MTRNGISIAIGILLTLFSSYSNADTMTTREKQRLCHCLPGDSCWPKDKDWAKFQAKLTGRLVQPVAPLAACLDNPESTLCAKAITNMHNPFFNASDVASTQNQGLFQAWRNQMSVYAVEAETPEDVANAVKFAHANKLKIAIKNTGHDYLGRSTSPDSLLIWTHNLRKLEYADVFTPAGCYAKDYNVPAVTVGAGTKWLDVYNEVTSKHHRYVQGSGSNTVGATGGFTQGGGFGSFSKKFGTGAANLLQAEIVTARGDLIIANPCQHADLFWALKGGGAGTFGVVTSMTFKTYALPTHAGLFKATITAKSDTAYNVLLEQFLVFFRQYLNNDHWGEQISFDRNNQINIAMVFQDLDEDQVNKTWQPLLDWLHHNANSYTEVSEMFDIPPEKLWDINFWKKNYPTLINANLRANAGKDEFWWTGDTEQVGAYWYSYQSWWLPLSLFEDGNIKSLASNIFKASRLAPVTFHMNKGLAGASVAVMQSTRETAMNPEVMQAAVLVTMAAGDNDVYPGVKDHDVDKETADRAKKKIAQAMQYFYAAAPNAGTYVNEADYFQKSWQQAFWGENYSHLLEVKQTYDPDGVFYCHHCVGSEKWQEGGVCLAVR